MIRAEVRVFHPTFADDVTIASDTPKNCGKAIHAFREGLFWSRCFVLKPPKCRYLAFKRFTSNQSIYIPRQHRRFSSFDPCLEIDGIIITYIGDDDPPLFKYVGTKIQYDLGVDTICDKIQHKLEKLITIVDTTYLTGPMKAWIMNNSIIPKISWDVMVHNILLGIRKHWTNIIHMKFRKWIGLAKSAEPSVLYRSYSDFGLAFKHLDEVIDRLQVVKCHLLKYSKDQNIRDVYNYKLKMSRMDRKLSSPLRKSTYKKRSID